MLGIIITFSLLSVLRVDGIEPETGHPPTRAVSTQSYHRGDVPLSYTITSYHDYTNTRPETRVPIYAVNNHLPQYQAPQKTIEHNEQLYQPSLQSAHEEQQKLRLFNQNHPNENNLRIYGKYINKNYLEPRLVANYELKNNKQRSFVPGHNVAVAPNSIYRSPLSNDPYKQNQEPVQTQMIGGPKYIINDKHKQPLLIQSQAIKAESKTQHLENAGFPVNPIQNYHVNSYIPEYAHAHNQVQFPQLPPRAPRLHLNIARVYGVAHIPYQAHGPAVNIEKPLSHTQAIIKPHPKSANKDKTVLYPVHDFQRYPIHVV